MELRNSLTYTCRMGIPDISPIYHDGSACRKAQCVTWYQRAMVTWIVHINVQQTSEIRILNM